MPRTRRPRPTWPTLSGIEDERGESRVEMAGRAQGLRPLTPPIRNTTYLTKS